MPGQRQDNEYGNMTPKQIKTYEENARKYEMTSEDISKQKQLIKEGKLIITHVNRILDMKNYANKQSEV